MQLLFESYQRERRFAAALKRGAPVTKGLLLTIGVVFLLGLLFAGFLWVGFGVDFSQAISLVFGAKHNDLVREGQVWRLVTSIFMHVSLLHILLNGYALWILGPLNERLFGSRRFFVLFMLSGLTGSVASFLFTDQPSAGASGAIFGLLGAALVFGVKFRRDIPRRVARALTTGLLPWVGLNLVLGFSFEGIDNAAHLGGMAGGALVALIMGSAINDRSAGKTHPLLHVAFGIMIAVLGYALIFGTMNTMRCMSSASQFKVCAEPFLQKPDGEESK